MKTKVAVTLAMLVIGLHPLAAQALPAVQLKPDCGYVYNTFESTPAGFDAAATQLLAILAILHVKNVPVSSWAECDLETDGDGDIVGDHLPDSYQMAMLGAALCSGDGALVGKFQANRAKVLALMDAFVVLFGAYTPFPSELKAVATPLVNWANTLPDGYVKDEAPPCSSRAGWWKRAMRSPRKRVTNRSWPAYCRSSPSGWRAWAGSTRG